VRFHLLTRNDLQHGFSLLEVIVAMAILGICVTVLLRIFSGISSATHITDGYFEALEIAQTQMALLSASENPVGRKSGSAGDYRWKTEVEEYRPGLNNPLNIDPDLIDLNNNYITFHFLVAVSWGDHSKRTLELSTIRLGVRP